MRAHGKRGWRARFASLLSAGKQETIMRAAIIVVLAVAVGLPGCGRLRDALGGGATAVSSTTPPARPNPVAPPPGVTATAASLDTVSEAEKAEARAVAAAAPAGGTLGEETVALGDPTDAGLWVKTGLVTAEVAGTVRTAGGEAVAVTLRPLGGAGGAQISLSALQALGLPLAGLHPVTVARR